MKPETIPEHLRPWWMNQYEAVQEFGRVLLNEESSSPRLIAFFEMLARHTPKLRSVRMTNVLHALWHVVPDDALFEMALKHYRTPTEISAFRRLVASAYPSGERHADNETKFDVDGPIDEVVRRLEAKAAARGRHAG